MFMTEIDMFRSAMSSVTRSTLAFPSVVQSWACVAGVVGGRLGYGSVCA